MNLDNLIGAAKSEWANFFKARRLAIPIIVLSASSSWYLCEKLRQDEIAALRERNSDYQERLHLVPAAQSRFSRLTLNELVSEALDYSSRIRSLRATYLQKSTDLMLQRSNEAQNLKSADEQAEIAHRFNEADRKLTEECMARYDQDLKVQAWLLRLEMDSRLSREARLNYQNSQTMLYFRPTNFWGLEIVANDLEGTARLLVNPGRNTNP